MKSKVFRSFKFSASEWCTELRWIRRFESDFFGLSGCGPGFTVDLASKLTDNKTPKHNLQKTENQNKPKSNRYGCYCCWFPPVRSSQKLLTSRFVKVHQKISLCWQKCSSCSNTLSTKNDRILSNIVLQVNKYGGIYRLGVQVPAGSIVKTTLWIRKQTLQSCVFDFHVNHLKKEELKHWL